MKLSRSEDHDAEGGRERLGRCRAVAGVVKFQWLPVKIEFRNPGIAFGKHYQWGSLGSTFLLEQPRQ